MGIFSREINFVKYKSSHYFQLQRKNNPQLKFINVIAESIFSLYFLQNFDIIDYS